MTYVMSDIHGEYEKYMKILEMIDFSDNDVLYVLGDVVDRGKEPVKVLLDMMNRFNVYPIMGNHDCAAVNILKKMSVEITADNYSSYIDADMLNEMIEWLSEGGDTTFEEFVKLDNAKRREIIEYIEEFPLCEVIDVGQYTFILVHAGLGNFRKDKKLKEYTPYELMMMRTDPDDDYFDDKSVYVVSGHTPVRLFTEKNEIFINKNNIMIDCGACFKNGRLACLCLENMRQFYA